MEESASRAVYYVHEAERSRLALEAHAARRPADDRRIRAAERRNLRANATIESADRPIDSAANSATYDAAMQHTFGACKAPAAS
jgi:hypothetical protein